MPDSSLKKLAIIVVEDRHDIRQRLAQHIQSCASLELFGTAATCSQGAKIAESLVGPGILIQDVSLPDGDGIASMQQLLDKNPDLKAVIFTVNCDERTIIRGLRAGASGYLSKTAALENIEEQLWDIYRGSCLISPGLTHHVVNALRSDAHKNCAANLASAAKITSREREILQMVSKGLTSAEVASALGISTSTVIKHLKNSYRRLGVRNRTEAIFEAQLLNLI